MLQRVVCWGKSKTGECNKFDIGIKSEDIKITKLCLSNISDLQSKLDKCIKKNNIEDVLKFSGDCIDEYYWNEVKEKELNLRISNNEDLFLKEIGLCKLKPDVCRIVFASKEGAFEKLARDLDNKIKKYNQELAIIKQIQNYCSDCAENKINTKKDVYFKFGRDIHGDLIALYFNIKNFIDNNKYSPVETVYVFSGDSEYPFHKHTMLHLKYEEYSFSLSGTEVYGKLETKKNMGYQAHICDFISNNQKRGQGTFLLNQLEDIIRQVNKKIDIIQKIDKQRYPQRKPIVAINGVVVPRNISYEKLVEVYNKNGFPTIGIMDSEGNYAKDRIIYKELT